MTLRLLKKRPTTPPSIRGWNRRNGLRLLGAAIALGSAGMGVSMADEPGETMLEALSRRDAAAHWEATADMLPAAPKATAQAPASVEEESSSDGWRARETPLRTAQRELPPAPDMYDPPLTTPAPETDDPFEEDEPLEEGDDDDQVEMEPELRPIARTPEELRDIESILPYSDYDPNPGDDDQEGQRVPEEEPLGTEPFVGRALPPSVFAWKASNVTHNPLYFQDVALERYGHAYHPLVQPVVSIGRFSGQVVSLPYHMTLDPPCKEMYPLGYYRPGECAPKLLYQPPLNAKAAAVTAGFYTGFGLILP